MNLLDRIKGNCIASLQGIRRHPVLLVILCHAWIASSLIDQGTSGNNYSTGFGFPVLAPVFAFLSVFIDRLACRKMKWSWILLPLYIGSCYLKVLDGFEETVAFHVICFAILPLCYLWIARAKNDIPFIRQTAVSINSLIHALIFTAAPTVLTLLIIWSIRLLFGLFSDTAFIWPLYFYFIVLFPSLFVSFDERNGNDGYFKLVETIINWVLTPALIIYALILYIYLIKIIASWTLPLGGVVAMVLSFSVILFLCTSYRRIQVRKTFNWFYDHSWLIAIPLFVLFWAGIVRRLSDYGCTSNRYYIVICGLAMMILIFRRKLKDSSSFYHHFCMILSCVLVLSIFCPGISHQDVSFASQRRIVMHESVQLGLLNSDGKFEDRLYSCKDSTDAAAYRKIYKALFAMNDMDTSSCRNYFGLDSPHVFLERLPSEAQNFAASYRTYLFSEPISEILSIALQDYIKIHRADGFKYLCTDIYLTLDELKQVCIEYDGTNFIEHQAAKCGWDKSTSPPAPWIEEHGYEMLTIRAEGLEIAISHLTISRDKNSGGWEIQNGIINVEYILFNDESLIDRLKSLKH